MKADAMKSFRGTKNLMATRTRINTKSKNGSQTQILYDDFSNNRENRLPIVATLDVFIADLLEAKLRLINAVKADDAPNGSVLNELYEKLRSFGPALLQENKALQATGEIRDRIEALAKTNLPEVDDAPLLETGVHEFKSSRDPSMVYCVTFGRAGHLECSCEGFRWRGNCKHVREVRGIS